MILRVLQFYVRPQNHLQTNHWFKSLLITFLRFWCSPLCLYRKKLLFFFFFVGVFYIYIYFYIYKYICIYKKNIYVYIRNPSGLIFYDISTTVHFLMLYTLLAKKEKKSTKKRVTIYFYFLPKRLSALLHVHCLVFFNSLLLLLLVQTNSLALHVIFRHPWYSCLALLTRCSSISG